MAIRNSQRIAIQWFCITECSNILCAKISFASFGVSIDDFFKRYVGLGYSLKLNLTCFQIIVLPVTEIVNHVFKNFAFSLFGSEFNSRFIKTLGFLLTFPNGTLPAEHLQ